MNKKYVIMSGMVRSRDGDFHIITCRALMNLYRVYPKDCICVSHKAPYLNALRGYTQEQLDKLIWLYPQDDVDDYKKIRDNLRSILNE